MRDEPSSIWLEVERKITPILNWLSIFLRRVTRLWRVGRAIMLGKYECSGWDTERHYVDYKYKGVVFRVPDTFEDEDDA